MGVVIAVATGAGLFGWLAAGEQHLLYRTPGQRDRRARGRKLLLLRTFLAVACATVAGLAVRPGHFDPAPAALTVFFGLVLCVLASTDLDQRLIPDRLSLPAIGLALAFAWAWPQRSVADILAGAALGLGIAVALVVMGIVVGVALKIRATPFGIGDAKLILLLGLLCGWPGLMSALLYGIVLAGLAAFVLLLRRGARSTYAYGPYLALGGLIVLLWPERFI